MTKQIEIVFHIDPEHKFMKKRKSRADLVYYMECRFFNNRRTIPENIIFDKVDGQERLTLVSRVNEVSHRLLLEDSEAFFEVHYANSLEKSYGVKVASIVSLYGGDDPYGDEEDQFYMNNVAYTILNRWD